MLSAVNTAKPNESYAYDLNGNRTGADGASGFTTGGDNRLASDATYAYQYDGEGNRTLRTTTATGETAAYAWDDRNRLTGVTFKDGSGVLTKQVDYTYDASDRRTSRKVTDATGA